MSKTKFSDPITDQEIAFALLVLSGTMTDRRAAEAVGLDPDSTAYTKSKPCVRAYMLEHRCAVEQDTWELRQFNVGRDQVLARLWDIANMGPEMTRNSMSAQVKALSMIVAIEGLIPDRRAIAANKPAPSPLAEQFYKSAWNRTQQDGENADPQPTPASNQEEARQEDQPEAASEPQSAPRGADGPRLTESIFPGLEPLANEVPVPSRPYVRFVPDAKFPFPLPRNPFTRYR